MKFQKNGKDLLFGSYLRYNGDINEYKHNINKDVKK